ncbi:GAF domain-containing protein [Jatrophihabitans endophyticus]|uniref:GAF domain-containing protein n=1 Tax=Jatrophihabitans endophyticus TaxID=1206085 RepID=A0A1M5CI75_9ACTN|nr:GAF domain-containing protein [Jatrophihabitans endophyticus]SHF54396.1 GAF domain-containing protein [Jatrophihabitans endophyticus]
MPVGGSLSRRAQRAHELAEAVSRSDAATTLDPRLAALCDELRTDGAALSAVSDRRVTLAGCGLVERVAPTGTHVPLDDAICANVLRHDGLLAIPDTRLDARVASIPVVLAGQVRAYLGSPVRCDGVLVGVLCVIAGEPRDWTADDEAVLTRYADEFARELRQLQDGAALP